MVNTGDKRVKVSVITPCFNSAKYIAATIQSVQSQSMKDWQMIVVDDCSTDNTLEIVQSFADKDPRIIVIRSQENKGAGAARTAALEYATGRYIAYLDADDIWKPDKLEKQTRFMEEHQYAFSCTSYEVIDDNGNRLNKTVTMLPVVDYIGFLTNNLLQTVGIMVDTTIVPRELLRMPDIRRRQDAATWLNILKNGYSCYGMTEVLAEYRRANNSLSSNKFSAVKGTWKLYREIEGLSLPFSCYCFCRYAVLAVWKRIYLHG